ncbi:MAG: hypothetical protein QNJ63_27745 [Calothrix sp. MO_192.B10]|nr:hypothetical protein [Calothrix sp. MO_192.B10]
MKRILASIAIILLIISLTTTEAMAQVKMHGHTGGCYGHGCHGYCHHGAVYYEPGDRGCYHPRGGYYESGSCHGCYPPRADYYKPDWSDTETYSPVALETISGEAIDVYQVTARRGQGYGLHLLLRTSDQTIDVHLSPVRYLENEDFRIERGDVLEIKGEPVPTQGLSAMIAFEVKKGNDVLALRDENGYPLWRG